MKELAFRVIELLKEKNLTLATAESCTGGLISKAITDVSGASEVFLGGIVSYANEVKHKILGVKNETLASYGAVSCQTAEEMALGASRACFSSVSISTTGIAGPGIASSYLINHSPSLTREEIRNKSCEYALKLLIDKLSKI